MKQQEEEKKGSELNIKEESQESDEKALNVLLIGTSGSGKSSLINYLAGREDLATVGKGGSSCTKDNMFYDITFERRKLRIFDTQGFNDTEGITDETVASKIKS
jgi:predicted GTPase